MSLGGVGRWEVYQGAVDAVVDAGVTVVIASGNSYSDACNFSPAFVASAITVGSTDYRSGFSNFGTCVDILAPGSSVVSADGRGIGKGGPILNNASRTTSGTSMACPHVAGAAALWLEINNSFTPADLLAAMKRNVSTN